MRRFVVAVMGRMNQNTPKLPNVRYRFARAISTIFVVAETGNGDR